MLLWVVLSDKMNLNPCSYKSSQMVLSLVGSFFAVKGCITLEHCNEALSNILALKVSKKISPEPFGILETYLYIKDSGFFEPL